MRIAVDEVVAAEEFGGRGATADLRYHVGVPPVVNDPAVNAARCGRRAGSEVVGAEKVLVAEQSRGGDSCAWYAARRAGGLHPTRRPRPQLAGRAASISTRDASTSTNGRSGSAFVWPAPPSTFWRDRHQPKGAGA